MKEKNIFLRGIVFSVCIIVCVLLSINFLKASHGDVSYFQAEKELRNIYVQINQIDIEAKKGNLEKINEIFNYYDKNNKPYLSKNLPERSKLVEKTLFIDAKYGYPKILFPFYKKEKTSNELGTKLLIIAASNGQNDIINFLLDNGVDVNSKTVVSNKYGYSNPPNDAPLLAAAKSGNTNTVKLLLSKGADINITDNIDKDALYYATTDLREDLVNLLISKGANINGNYGQVSFFALLVRGGLDNIAKKLVNRVDDINMPDEWGTYPIFAAAKNGDLELVKLLINKGAKLQKDSDTGINLLTYAAESGNKNLIDFVLKKGFDINQINSLYQTPIMFAAEYSTPNTFNYMLNKGAELSQVSKEGETAASYAIANNNIPVLKLIIDKQNVFENPTYANELMVTAARHNNIEAFKMFFNKGVKVNDNVLHWLTSDKCDSNVPFLNHTEIANLVNAKYPRLISSYEQRQKNKKKKDKFSHSKTYLLPKQEEILKADAPKLYENIKLTEKIILKNWNNPKLKTNQSALIQVTSGFNENGEITDNTHFFDMTRLENSRLIDCRKFYKSAQRTLDISIGDRQNFSLDLIRLYVNFSYDAKKSIKTVKIDKIELIIYKRWIKQLFHK